MLVGFAVLLCCGLCAIHVFVPAAALAYIVTPSTRPVLDGDFPNLIAWDLAAGRLRHDRLGCRSAGRRPIDHRDKNTGLPKLFGKR